MNLSRRTLAIAAIAITWAQGGARADGVPPIVNPKQMLYGSAAHTITSNSDVTIDTTTHQVSLGKGVKTSTITFVDGTILASSSGIVGISTWGSITGTLKNRSEERRV